MGSPCYFLSSRGQQIKNITKIKQKRLILFIFLVSFLMPFLMQKLIYTINIWFNFVLAHFFEQDHLLNLFILGVYAKKWPKCARISIQKLTLPKIWLMIFLWLWLSEDLSIGRILCEKKSGGTGLISEKMQVLYAQINKRVDAATSSYSVTGNFLQCIYSVPVAKNHQNIWSRCLVHEFSFRYFLTILMFTEQLY